MTGGRDLMKPMRSESVFDGSASPDDFRRWTTGVDFLLTIVAFEVEDHRALILPLDNVEVSDLDGEFGVIVVVKPDRNSTLRSGSCGDSADLAVVLGSFHKTPDAHLITWVWQWWTDGKIGHDTYPPLAIVDDLEADADVVAVGVATMSAVGTLTSGTSGLQPSKNLLGVHRGGHVCNLPLELLGHVQFLLDMLRPSVTIATVVGQFVERRDLVPTQLPAKHHDITQGHEVKRLTLGHGVPSCASAAVPPGAGSGGGLRHGRGAFRFPGRSAGRGPASALLGHRCGAIK
mmetsp:Transcript_13487/g.31993  ORF Transcript_13487/g.31993 Transcript_13487/m.31993 type:complete len:289 (-) Transcript_13487:163-1029(-)